MSPLPTVIASPMPDFTTEGAILGSFVSVLFIGFIFWMVALIDILKSEFKDPTNKVIWIVLTLVLPFLGPLLYFLIGRKQVKSSSGISLRVVFTVLSFFVWYPLGVVLMWVWTSWPKWVKVSITVVLTLLFLLPFISK